MSRERSFSQAFLEDAMLGGPAQLATDGLQLTSVTLTFGHGQRQLFGCSNATAAELNHPYGLVVAIPEPNHSRWRPHRLGKSWGQGNDIRTPQNKTTDRQERQVRVT